MWDIITKVMEHAKVIGSCVAGIAACVTGYVQFGGPIPASQQWVLAQNEKAVTRVIEQSLQLNKFQIDALRKEKLDREIQVQTETNPAVKSLFKQRLDNVNDSLDEAQKQKQDLEAEKKALVK